MKNFVFLMGIIFIISIVIASTYFILVKGYILFPEVGWRSEAIGILVIVTGLFTLISKINESLKKSDEKKREIEEVVQK